MQARTRCPECGLSTHRQYREDARRIVGRPTYLALLALVFWRPLPLALWSTRASARVIRGIRRNTSRLRIWTLILGAVLVSLLGALYAFEWEILETPGGYKWSELHYDLWGLHCHRATQVTPVPDRNSLIRRESLWADSPYDLTWRPRFYPELFNDWHIPWGHVADTSLPLQQLVFLPATAYILSLAMLAFVSRQATHRPGDIRLSRLSRATLMAAASTACLTPLRLAWFATFLVAVPFLLAPSVGLPLRRAAWYFLVIFATMGPSVIAARLVLADRPGNYIRGRRFVALMLVLFGGIIPGILGGYILCCVTGMLCIRGNELLTLPS